MNQQRKGTIPGGHGDKLQHRSVMQTGLSSEFIFLFGYLASREIKSGNSKLSRSFSHKKFILSGRTIVLEGSLPLCASSQ